MATLQLLIPATTKAPILTERGEGYEQLWHFHDVTEINWRLDNLDLQPWQLKELWAGREVELTDWQSWPHRVEPERKPAQPARPSDWH